MNVEVDGIAALVLVGPSPVGVFDDQPLVAGQFHVASGQRDHLQPSAAQQRGQRSHPGDPDLLTGPTGWRCRRWGFMIWVGHSLSSNGLNEHAVDLFEIDDAGLVAHGLDQGGEAEVSGPAQDSFAGSDDQGQGRVLN